MEFWSSCFIDLALSLAVSAAAIPRPG